MTLEPLFSASPAIQAHVIGALAALVLGLAQLSLPKGSPPHRAVGWIWVALMAIAAITSFWIHEIRQFGDWSLIHLLSIAVLISLVQAIHAARTGNRARHKRIMISLYTLALLVAGAFTLLPGRIMHQVVFGG